MKQNKICVYAIAKNEMKFIEKWIASMSEADYIVVLDTGSTDGTFEFLQNDPRITAVKQQVINPWRFDVARNESMKLIPEDANICVCTDPDELFEEGWANVLRTKWDDNLHYRAWYKYAWRHDVDGTPSGVFTYDKIHSRDGWKWIYPVHEVIAPEKDDDELDESRCLNLFDEIYLHHWQDRTISRQSYLPLLRIRVEEHPDDMQSRAHLVHDLLYNGLWQECIDQANAVLAMEDVNKYPDFKAHLYLYMGDAYQGLKNDQAAIDSYYTGITIANHYVEHYTAMAQVLLKYEKYVEAIDVLTEATKAAQHYYVWFQRNVECTEDTIYKLLATAYSCLGDYDHAFVNIVKAYHINPQDEVIVQNYSFIAEKMVANIGHIASNSVVK